MGCDIHAFREKHVDGKWKTADDWDVDPFDPDRMEIKDQAYTGRNYDLFGLLSKGVRRNFDFGLPARGTPLDASPEVKAEVEGWDCDGHSHSYLYLHELKSLREWCGAHGMPISGMMHRDQLVKLRAGMAATPPTFDDLYPYCQGTNDSEYEHFEIELPMEFIVGDCLDEIIKSFDGIEGENHRLVFFFDN